MSNWSELRAGRAHKHDVATGIGKGQRLNVPVEGGFAQAEVIEVTKLTTDEPIRWKLLAREVEKPLPQGGSIPIDRLNASNDD